MALPHLGPRARKVVIAVGWTLFALVAFVMALQLSFPYDRVKDKAAEAALAGGYELKVTRVERGWMPGRMIWHGVTLSARPTSLEEVPKTMFVDELEIDLGVLALFGGKASVAIDATLGRGRLAGTLDLSSGGTSIAMTGTNLAADNIPMLRDAIAGLPMFGTLDASVRLGLTPDFKKTSGAVQISCDAGCAIGDGQTKFKPKLASAKNAAMLGDGIPFGTINIDRWLARVELGNGKADLTRWEFESPDAELQLDLHLRLGRKLSDSDIAAGCTKFKGTDVLSKREPKTAAALTTTGAVMDTGGLFNIKLEGKFGDMKKRPRICSASGGDDGDGDGTTKPPDGRPTLGAPIADADGPGSPGNDVFAKTEPPPPPPTGVVPPVAPTAPIDAAPAPIDAREPEDKARVIAPAEGAAEPTPEPEPEPEPIPEPPAPEEAEPVPAPPE
jgi:type II secretion system protein N